MSETFAYHNQETYAKELPTGYSTDLGISLIGRIEGALEVPPLVDLKGAINLIFTSPPFPLKKQKQYGNRTGEGYVNWLSDLAPSLSDLLAPSGSIVIEIGNSWEPGKPVMSTLPIEALLRFRERSNLHLCQQFICNNPARLPGPAQWVNVERIRIKDSYTHVWWMSKSERPKADNRRVLTPYGQRMKKLLKTGKYNSGPRPSGHVIGKETFGRNNGGAIPGSVLEFSNTSWSADYLKYCRRLGMKPHPARMQPGLAAFFIKMLTDEGDLVFDPFAGSNTTGAVAESLKRRWLSIEADSQYVEASKGRFAGLT